MGSNRPKWLVKAPGWILSNIPLDSDDRLEVLGAIRYKDVFLFKTS